MQWYIMFFLVLSSCYITHNLKYSQLNETDRQYLQGIDNTANEFELPDTLSDRGWILAQEFLTLYSPSPIESVDEHTIITKRAKSREYSYWYQINRYRTSTGEHFSIRCFSNLSEAQRIYNEKALSYYIQSGHISQKMAGWTVF